MVEMSTEQFERARKIFNERANDKEKDAYKEFVKYGLADAAMEYLLIIVRLRILN